MNSERKHTMAFLKGMKPLPKALILGSPIALAVWAYIQFGPKPTPTAAPVVQATPVAVPAESTQASAPVPTAPVPPTPVAEAPSGLTPAGGQDAGLANVLKAGKK